MRAITGQIAWDTYAALFQVANREKVIGLIDSLLKSAYREGMEAAAKIAASYDMENSDYDTVARDVARAILGELPE